MKKTGHEKSRDTVPLNEGQEGAGGINIKGNRGRWKNLIFGQ
jgi:hypothetical protein